MVDLCVVCVYVKLGGYDLVETRDLTELEEKVLRTLAVQGGDRLTPSTLAETVGCSLSTLYQLLQDDHFHSVWISTLQRTVAGIVPEVLNSFETEARKGSFRHGKLLLEMTGTFMPKTQTEVKGDIRVEESPFRTTEARRDFLIRLLAQTPNSDQEPE